MIDDLLPLVPADPLDPVSHDSPVDACEEIDHQPAEREVPCDFLCGRAGVGKSFELMRRVKEDPKYALLCATTGIAAVNIGAVTLNSQLRYFNTDSMRDAFLAGHLTRRLHEIALDYRYLAVEESSMFDGAQLDILYRAIKEANAYADITRPMGLLLVGDFAQLPPIKCKWAFEADCWGHFAANTTRLEKVWRQDGGLFLDGLNAARAGLGAGSAELLSRAGITWHTALDTSFDGTTILPLNQMVNRYNEDVLSRLPGKRFSITSCRWGQQRSEWGENARTHEWGIPPTADFKLGAYVMILSNAPNFSYVNGDCGHVLENMDNQAIVIKLIRTGREIAVSKIVRHVDYKSEPDGWSGERIPALIDDGDFIPRAHFRSRVRRYVMGQIEYLPVRLAYASTVHKAQGLTLDRVQVDIRDRFFGQPAMAYVALSRCRTIEGLRIVGMRERFALQVKTDPKIQPWL